MATAMDIDDSTQAKCFIKELPLEVLLRITYPLKTKDLGSLRLSCRGIEELLHNSFAREFFSCKQFMISEFSLQTLIDISKSRMGPHLTRLQIGLEQFMPPHSIFAHTVQMRAREYQIPDDVTFHPYRTAELYSNQCTLWSSGSATEMLSEALRNLTNLKDVVLRDCNSRTRRRDYPAVEWRSYGIITALKEAGALVGRAAQSHSIQFANITDQIFSLLIHSMGKANVHPRGIEIICREFCHLSDYAFALPQYTMANVTPVLEGLEKLHITINGLGGSREEVKDAKTLFEKFIYHAKNLKDLRMNGPTGRGGHGLIPVLKCLANTEPDSPGAGVVELPKLKTLSLGFMEAESELLIDVIKKFASTLETLELWKVTACQSNAVRDLDLAADRYDEVSACRFFCKQLLKMPDLNLHHLKIGCLAELDHNNRVTGLDAEFEGKGSTVKYIGIDWQHFLKEAIPSLRLSPGKHQSRTHGHDDDDDDDGDGDDDEEDDEDDD